MVTSVKRRRLMYAAAIGVVGGIAISAFAFFVPQNPVANVLLYLGFPLAVVVGKLLPAGVASWLFPGGGPGAGLALLLASSTVTTCAGLSGIAYFLLHRHAQINGGARP
jgi:hypothetical protein